MMVFAVRYANYEPSEIESIWWTIEQAKARKEELNNKKDSTRMWEVEAWTVQGTSPYILPFIDHDPQS